MKYLLDTHTWIWWYMNPKKLSTKVTNLIKDTSKYEHILISAISPWEFCKLVEKKRLFIHGNPRTWLEQAFDLPKVKIVPLSPTIAFESTILPPPFHNDPADQIIVATAKLEKATILTKDKLLHNYPHVKCLW